MHLSVDQNRHTVIVAEAYPVLHIIDKFLNRAGREHVKLSGFHLVYKYAACQCRYSHENDCSRPWDMTCRTCQKHDTLIYHQVCAYICHALTNHHIRQSDNHAAGFVSRRHIHHERFHQYIYCRSDYYKLRDAHHELRIL